MARRIGRGVCALACAGLAIASCSTPQTDPGWQLVGVYDATEAITIALSGPPGMAPAPFTMSNPQAVHVYHGAYSNVVIDDGMCLLPATGSSATNADLQANSACTRTDPSGARILVMFTTGTAAIHGRSLEITADGSFTYVATDAGTTGDDGGSRPTAGTGTFHLVITGNKL